MYTYNEYCFGHDLSKDKKLNNLLWEFDFYFKEKIGNNLCELTFQYHGGLVSGDINPCIFGINITDDDKNPYYIDVVRNSKESDYIDDYNIFLAYIIREIGTYDDPETFETIELFKNFITNNKPCFYSVEVSS